MSELSKQLNQSRSLMEITDLVRNRRAFLTLFITLIGTVVIFAIFAIIASSMPNKFGAVFFAIGLILSITFFTIGVSGSGFLLTDLIYNKPQRSIADAFIVGFLTIPRILGIQLAIAALALLALLAMCILLFIAKIPAVGPFLYFFVYPVCILISAVTVVSLTYLTVLSGPAIWSGQGVLRTISILFSIFRTKIFAVILQQLLLGLIVFVVVSVLFSIISASVGFTSLLSVPILSIRDTDLLNSVGRVLSGSSLRYSNGYMIAAGLDLALIGAAAFTLPVLMFIAGNCIIFKNACEGLNTESFDKKIESGLKSIKEKANAAKEKINEAKTSLPINPPIEFSKSVSESKEASCNVCDEPVGPDDAFCGSCGNKIK